MKHFFYLLIFFSLIVFNNVLNTQTDSLSLCSHIVFNEGLTISNDKSLIIGNNNLKSSLQLQYKRGSSYINYASYLMFMNSQSTDNLIAFVREVKSNNNDMNTQFIIGNSSDLNNRFRIKYYDKAVEKIAHIDNYSGPIYFGVGPSGPVKHVGLISFF